MTIHCYFAQMSRSGLVGAAVAAAIGMVSAGCVIERASEPSCEDRGGYTPPVESEPSSGQIEPGFSKDVFLTDIDTDATMSLEPGEGVGVLVQYAQGGKWKVTTSCDTKISGAFCHFMILMQLPEGAVFTNVYGEDFESRAYDESNWDSYSLDVLGNLEFNARTQLDFDTLHFEAPEGETVRFSVMLDGEPEGRYFYWIANGVVHNGAPTNPIDLVPTVP